MKRYIGRLIKELSKGENIDLLATILVVISVSLAGSFGLVQPGFVNSIILVTLGLIAINLLITRYKMDEINLGVDPANLIRFHNRKITSLGSDLEKNDEIWMLGLQLRSTTMDNFHRFKTLASSGGKIRAMIANPAKMDFELLNQLFGKGSTPEHFRGHFDEAIIQYREIRSASKRADKIQLRLLDFAPPFSLYIFPKTENGGLIYVEIYSYKTNPGSIPRFCITESENPYWYNHYINQFETLWEWSTDGFQ